MYGFIRSDNYGNKWRNRQASQLFLDREATGVVVGASLSSLHRHRPFILYVVHVQSNGMTDGPLRGVYTVISERIKRTQANKQ